MSATTDSILGTVLALPPDERARIAAEIIASLDEGEDTDVETAWAAEIERRIAEVESGEAETVSWDEARVRVRAKLSRS